MVHRDGSKIIFDEADEQFGLTGSQDFVEARLTAHGLKDTADEILATIDEIPFGLRDEEVNRAAECGSLALRIIDSLPAHLRVGTTK